MSRSGKNANFGLGACGMGCLGAKWAKCGGTQDADGGGLYLGLQAGKDQAGVDSPVGVAGGDTAGDDAEEDS